MLTLTTHSKVLKSPDELATYIDHYNRQNRQFQSKVEDIAGKSVRMLYRKGRPVAGYVINTRPPFRFVETIPVEDRKSLNFFKNFSENECLEITTLWKDKANSKLYDRFRLYYMMLFDCTLSRKRILLGGALNLKVAQIQHTTLPHVLHSGQVSIDGTPKRYWIFYGSTRMLLVRAVISTPVVLIVWPITRWVKRVFKGEISGIVEFERTLQKKMTT